MPSAHAATALAIALLAPLSSALPIGARRLAQLGMLLVAGVVCWSRVHLHYHSTDQVIAGALLGFVVATVTRLTLRDSNERSILTKPSPPQKTNQ